MRFFKTFYNSLWNLSWLKSQRQAGGWAWGYFSLLVLLVTALFVVPSVVMLPKIGEEIRTVANKLPDFQASLVSGTLTVTGLEQPYESIEAVTMTATGNAENYTITDHRRTVLLVDTVSTSSVSLDHYQTATSSAVVFAITKDRIIFADGRNEQSASLKDFPDFTVSKTDIMNRLDKLFTPGMVALVGLLLLVVVFVVLFVSKLVAVLVVSLLVSFIASVSGKGWKFGELVKVSLFASTVPAIISILLALVGFQISFIHFLALLAFMLAVVFTKDGTEPVDKKA